MELHYLSLAQASKLLHSREISSVELTQAMIARLEATEPQLCAYLARTPELALAQARAADQALKDGGAGPLTGIPAGIKDVICTQGVTTTAASKILQNFVPPYDATLVARLKAARPGHAGQAQHGRVRHGQLHRELGLWPHPQPLGPGAPSPAAPRGARRPRWRRAAPSTPWAPTPAAPSASRPATAAWWG